MKTYLIACRCAVIAVMAGMVLGAGCVKIDAAVSLAPDGSGTVKAMYGMPTYLIKQAETIRASTRALIQAQGLGSNAPLPGADIPMIFDEAGLKARFSRMEKDGLKVTEFKLKEMGGWQYVNFTVKFTSLEAFARQSFFKDCGFRLAGIEDGAYRLVATLPKLGGGEGAPNFSDPEQMVQLTPFLNGLKVVVRLDLPGGIRQSTSTRSDGRRATWEWDFDKDSRVLEQLARDVIVVEFDGGGAKLKEFEKRQGTSADRSVLTVK